jgi:hypothetical protein
MKLWISNAVGPNGEPWGTIAVIAETREDAIAKARQRLEQMDTSRHPEAQEYRQSLIGNVALTMNQAVLGDVFIDLDPYTVNRFS